MLLEHTPHQVPQRGLDGQAVADVVSPFGASNDVVAEEDGSSGIDAAFCGCAFVFVAGGAVGCEDAAHCWGMCGLRVCGARGDWSVRRDGGDVSAVGGMSRVGVGELRVERLEAGLTSLRG